MTCTNTEFIVSTEQECLTVVEGTEDANVRCEGITTLLSLMSNEAPSLPCSSGFFNAYGRVYVDCGHIEMAFAECDSPYLLPAIIERQQQLAARAVANLARDGPRLRLANNNHSGLLSSDSPIWGAHENYLVHEHPGRFGEKILPFLATRIYAGSGGVHHPSGRLLAGVRAMFMKHAAGGGTTEERALHSTAREEHLMGTSTQSRYRYHLICGDGHRCHFNTALQFGATALALKAIAHDGRRIDSRLRKLGLPLFGSWVATLQHFNVLAESGQEPKVDPRVVDVQRIYLDSARRYADSLRDRPDWIPRLLDDWEATLDAFARGDRAWLAARLDAFAKYELYTHVLAGSDKNWGDLPRDKRLFYELALLDHSYHDFVDPGSVFLRLERAGVLRHRVSDPVAPGEEPEPYVPEYRTRARARARFIREHAGTEHMAADWTAIHDFQNGRYCPLWDPFAIELGEWQGQDRASRTRVARSRIDRARQTTAVIDRVCEAYARGAYDEAQRQLATLRARQVGGPPRARYIYLRYNAWTLARRGDLSAARFLDRLYAGRPPSLTRVTDYCLVHRFAGLRPSPRIDRWLEEGQGLLFDETGNDHPDAGAYREHLAHTLLRRGQPRSALETLEEAITPARMSRTPPRIAARLYATLAETHRVLGDADRAERALDESERICRQHNYEGERTDFILTSRARLHGALEPLREAKSIQTTHQSFLSLTRTLLLEARLSPDPVLQRRNHRQILDYRNRLPALAECRLLATLLAKWDDWLIASPLTSDPDPFWGV